MIAQDLKFRLHWEDSFSLRFRKLLQEATPEP